MYRVDVDHDHDSKDSASSHGLSQNVKKQIDKLFELNLKPMSIMNSLSKIEGIRLPKMTQLKNYLSDRRRAKYGNQTISLGEFEAWLLSHSTVPDDPHQPFVISYNVFDNESTPHFRFVLSTKYLLELACGIEILHADATRHLPTNMARVSCFDTWHNRQK
jgi:hypothetical protein